MSGKAGARGYAALKARRTKAVCIVGITVGLTLGICSAAQAAEPTSISTGDVYAQSIWETMKRDGNTVQALEGLGFCISADEMPEWFSEEIGVFSGSEFVASVKDQSIVLFKSALSAKDMAEAITGELQCKGWIALGSNAEETVTFTKGEGVCRWMMMNCIRIGDETSAVLHIQRF